MTATQPGAPAERSARTDATRRSYGTVAAAYRRLPADQPATASLDRGVLAAFAERVAAGARADGHEVDLDVYRWAPDLVARLLGDAGLVESARLVREPGPSDASPQGFALARKPRTA
ncbi:hypothetical protein ACFVU3_04255 [Streptomyces sp. NPDC058052]|uniref:hypothetical protein n=1 Tax=Streptomyces sp. NPDC058052 TaxID=3346316 RepID=UPI0036E7BB6F